MWFSPSSAIAQSTLPSFASIYSPSLLPVVMPQLEPLAEATYSQANALTGLRPLRAPNNTSLYLPGQGQETVTNYYATLPGVPNYMAGQNEALIATRNLLSNNFANAPAASQVSPIPDPNLLRYVYSAAHPASLGSLPTGIMPPQSQFTAIQNPTLNLLQNANLQGIAQRLASLKAPMQSVAPSTPAFSNAPYIAPRIGGISLIPSAQQILSVLGPEQMLKLLNQINPVRFSVTNIQFAPKDALAQALNNLSYNDIILLMDMMPVTQRMQVYMLLGLPMGEALVLAQNGLQGLFLPTLGNALASQRKKEIVPPSATPTPILTAPEPIIPTPAPRSTALQPAKTPIPVPTLAMPRRAQNVNTQIMV